MSHRVGICRGIDAHGAPLLQGQQRGALPYQGGLAEGSLQEQAQQQSKQEQAQDHHEDDEPYLRVEVQPGALCAGLPHGGGLHWGWGNTGVS